MNWGGTQQSGRSGGYHQTPRTYHVWHRILNSGLKTHAPEAGGKEGGVRGLSIPWFLLVVSSDVTDVTGFRAGPRPTALLLHSPPRRPTPALNPASLTPASSSLTSPHSPSPTWQVPETGYLRGINMPSIQPSQRATWEVYGGSLDSPLAW